VSGEAIAILLAVVLVALAIVPLGAHRPLALAATTLARLGLTTYIFVRYALEGAQRRFAGERNLGPELVRRAFEDLGPTYLKLAQLIASSSGLFPERYCREFQKTLDRVKPFAFADVERILREELGDAAAATLLVEARPLASASIAQVHAATLPDGREVVLKIQRPHIERRIQADVRILRVGAHILSLAPTVELANPIAIIDDFARTLAEELDFELEARNMDEFNRIMTELGHADVRAPRVHHEWTTRRVITMERFRGVRVDDVPEVRRRFPELDSEAKLIHGLHAWFQSMILYGFFHGDVHAGNLMLLDDASLGFLDFGIIGRFDARTRRQIADYIVAFASADYPSLVRALLAMDAVAAGVDEAQLAADLKKAYAPMLTLSFGDLNYADVLPAIMRNAVKHRMRLPREFVLVTKQMLYFDRYAKLLAPRLNVFSDPRMVASIGQDVMRARGGGQFGGAPA
jgi:aarF domain-containing kinase